MDDRIIERLRSLGTTTADSAIQWPENKLTVLQRLFGTPDDARYEQETLGVDDPTFKPAVVREIFWKPRVGSSTHQPYFFVSIIPDATSTHDRSSRFLMASIGARGTILYGLESINVCQPSDYADKVIAHLKALRSQPGGEYARLVVEVRTGFGMEAIHARHLIQQAFPDSISIRDSQDAYKLIECMRPTIESGELCISDTLITSHPCPSNLLRKMERGLVRVKEWKSEESQLAMALLRANRARDVFFHSDVYVHHRGSSL